MSDHRKQEVITFKVDASLWSELQGVPNRSEFIRAAILSALKSTCPLCKGAGVLTSDQRKHWERFLQTHSIQKCDDCHAIHLVCDEGTPELPASGGPASQRPS